MNQLRITTFLAFVTFAIIGGLFFLAAAHAEKLNWISALDDDQLTKQITKFKQLLEHNPDDYEMLKAMGIAYHFRAIRSDKKNAMKSVEFLSKAREFNKEDNETLCYLGSATTMLAQTTWNPIKKMSYANKGIALMDKAVRRNPNNISVRMTRGRNSMNLPDFLKRVDTGIEDFEHLASLIEAQPNDLKPIAKDVYTNLSSLYERRKEEAKAKKYAAMAQNL